MKTDYAECPNGAAIRKSREPFDYTVSIGEGHRPRLLQLTDMQIIDSSKARRPDRLCQKENDCWRPENMNAECFDHISSVVAQTRPDMIFITGDVVYGEFDDDGGTLALFRDFMDSLGIPWAPVFGNHDNEARIGVSRQCDILDASDYCVFSRGHTTGNGNYSVLLEQNGQPVRALYMMDSHGCGGSGDPNLYRAPGFSGDQIDWLKNCGDLSVSCLHRAVPAFVCFHIPSSDVYDADIDAAYLTKDNPYARFTLSATAGNGTVARNGDFGCHGEAHSCFASSAGFWDGLRAVRADGVCFGHCHANNTSVLWKGIRWTYGLKTGQYDYHTVGQLGGTLYVINPSPKSADCLPDNTDDAPFSVFHVPALSVYGPSKY